MQYAVHRIDELVDAFTSQSSGWTVNGVVDFKLCNAVFDPVGASSYIPTPQYIANKHATLNLHNDDEFCFLYAVLAASHYQKDHAQRISIYKRYLNELFAPRV
jgi:hypothetical protein